MKRPGGNEQDVVGSDHAVACVDGGAFDDGQNIALHAFAGNVRAMAGFAAGDFVDFVDENNSHLLGALDGHARDQLHIQQLVFLFLDQVFKRVGHAHFALFLLLAENAGKHVVDLRSIHAFHLAALAGNNFERGHHALAHLQVHHALIQLAFAKLRAQLFACALILLALRRDFAFRSAGSGRRKRRKQEIEHAFFRGLFSAVRHFIQLFLANHVNRGFHKVAHHGLHIAAYITDFRVFRGFHLDKRASRKSRQAAGNLGFPHACRSYHQNIFRQDVIRNLRRKFLPAHAVAQGHGDGAFRGRLPDDILVELDDNLARRHVIERRKNPFLFARNSPIAARRKD